MSEITNDKLYCYRHPDRETLLRCNRCEKPICSNCAILTPTGYRCVECVRSQQKIFETAQWFDYPLSMGIAGLLSFIGSYFTSMLGFFTLFLAPVIGMIIAEIVRKVIKKRRSRKLFRWVTAAAVVGSLPFILIYLINFGFSFGAGEGSSLLGLLPLAWRGIYTFLMASTLYYRLSGIRV